MLANLLAIVIGLGSFAFYMAAFFVPEVHRRSDFWWSGVGLFYSVVLWFCAGQMTSAILLGQIAAVALLLWLGWQTLSTRRATTPLAQQTPIRSVFQQRTIQTRQRLEQMASRRPAAPEYEFVEDGIVGSNYQPSSVALEAQEPHPSPSLESGLEKNGADIARPVHNAANERPHEFQDEPLMVRAAITSTSQPQVEESDPSLTATKRLERQVSQPQSSTSPGLLAKVGIVLSWLKELMTTSTKPKPSRPMIELPPRPPSIPRPMTASEGQKTGDTADGADKGIGDSEKGNGDDLINPEPSPSTDVSAEPVATQSSSSEAEKATHLASDEPSLSENDKISNQDEDEEMSNWPEEEFWD